MPSPYHEFVVGDIIELDPTHTEYGYVLRFLQETYHEINPIFTIDNVRENPYLSTTPSNCGFSHFGRWRKVKAPKKKKKRKFSLFLEKHKL